MRVHAAVLIYMLLCVLLAPSTESKPRTNKKNAINFWKKLFCHKWLDWPWSTDNPDFTIERISEMRKLTRTCKVDVGTCPVGSCSTRTFHIPFFKCPDDGYICPEMVTRTSDCGSSGMREYQFVTRCKCCKDNGIIVTGTVADADTNQPLSYIRVKVTRKVRDMTDIEGMFNVTIESDERSIVIRAEDKQNVYMDALKIVDIPEGFRGPIDVKLFMIKKADPVEIDSTTESTLSLSKDPKDLTIGNAIIEIAPNSFKDNQGITYSGKVSTSVTFVDSNEVPESIIPGRFITSSGENLISDGIVSFDFKTPGGVKLMVEGLKFKLRKDMRMWDLDTKTGHWVPSKVLPNRVKRQVILTEEFLINVMSGRWYNIDKIPRAPKCYFKARIYNETTGKEITSSTTASFRPDIVAYTFQKQRLRLYSSYSKTPSDTCYEVRCPNVANPDEALAGFINMTATETVSIGGAFIPSLNNLKPKPLIQYAVNVKTNLEDVQYAIAPNGLDIFVNFVSGSNGPFFTNKKNCELSDVNEAALHFYKADPPSYEPSSNETDLCTARIALRDNWNFLRYLTGLESLPTLTTTSVWQEDGQDLFHNHATTVEISNVTGQQFMFACVEYKCRLNNSTEAPPTVYLDIAIPNITYSYNYTARNGSLISENYTMPAFYCDGSCDGSLCRRRWKGNGTMSVDGSFTAPTIFNSGPDFFDSIENSCKDHTDLDPFGYEFRCHGNEEHLAEGSDQPM